MICHNSEVCVCHNETKAKKDEWKKKTMKIYGPWGFKKSFQRCCVTDLFPLGYCTTMSWSSSMPHTVPVVVSVSNMPSVQPPWPCCSDWTISRSKSMLTKSPICRPPGFLFPFCSPTECHRGMSWIINRTTRDFSWSLSSETSIHNSIVTN